MVQKLNGPPLTVDLASSAVLLSARWGHRLKFIRVNLPLLDKRWWMQSSSVFEFTVETWFRIHKLLWMNAHLHQLPAKMKKTSRAYPVIFSELPLYQHVSGIWYWRPAEQLVQEQTKIPTLSPRWRSPLMGPVLLNMHFYTTSVRGQHSPLPTHLARLSITHGEIA